MQEVLEITNSQEKGNFHKFTTNHPDRNYEVKKKKGHLGKMGCMVPY